MGQEVDLESVDPELTPHCTELPFLHTLYKQRVTARQSWPVKAAAAKLYENLVVCGLDGKGVQQRTNFASCSQESSFIGMK